MPSRDINTGDLPTIYAKVACPKCGQRLTDEAGRKLVELFKDVSIPEENGTIIKQFIAGLILVPFALAFVLLVGAQMDWWGYSAFVFLAVSAVFIQPLIMLMNYRIAMLRSRCDCGEPVYLFMGMLGRTYCYRCSSCGRLLRLRD
jgi:DNA-directed RNA polymerase subunit RPC12/RpoP